MENAEHSQPAAAPRVPLGGDYWEAEPTTPLWGYADLHAHLMAHLAFGGKAFWGEPYDPGRPGAEGMPTALSSCAPIHGGLININPEFGHIAGGGWPEFIVWPRFTTLIHQQAYIDWIYRAYQGGLRLITCLAVNNELLGAKSSPHLPHDDKTAILAQVAGMKEMAATLAAQAGGAEKCWLQIVYSPEEARQVVSENRLAIILGVEVDSLGNWRRLSDLEELCHGDLTLARQLIGQELDWLFNLGVRQVTPIHLTNNAFGGTAIYMRFLETINVFVTGERWTFGNAWNTGVRYRLDHDGVDLVDEVERTAAVAGPRIRAMHRQTLLDHIPGIRDLYEATELPKVQGGHANTRGLNEYGHVLLEEMMARGMIIDVDHMSEKATDEALGIAEAHHYPVITSHSWFRDLLYSASLEFDPLKQENYGTSDVHKVAHEAGKRGDQIERIGRLGGVVAPIINQGDIAGLRRGLPEQEAKVPEPCAGSSTSWAQAYLYAVAKMGGRGVAIGTDINGAAALPGPRFGVCAAYGANRDQHRTPLRRGEIDRQTNGVAYDRPLMDHRWYRFEQGGSGGYDKEETAVWQAVAQYATGFNPDVHTHPASDFPDPNLREVIESLEVHLHLEKVDHLTRGLWLADALAPVDAAALKHWPAETQAAYLARKGLDGIELHENEHVLELTTKVKVIWDKWQQMQGSNRPLVRSTAGPLRDFDINLDGMAHYGMLPDFLQDVRNDGLSAEDLAPLFRSAFDYIEMWTACEKQAAESKA